MFYESFESSLNFNNLSSSLLLPSDLTYYLPFLNLLLLLPRNLLPPRSLCWNIRWVCLLLNNFWNYTLILTLLRTYIKTTLTFSNRREILIQILQPSSYFLCLINKSLFVLLITNISFRIKSFLIVLFLCFN